jgi:hypothetical protein
MAESARQQSIEVNMPRKLLDLSTLLFTFVIASGLWACYGGTATITELPNPADDDRPPGSAPELPRLQVDLPPAQVTGNAHVITDGNDLQSAIYDAKPGDVIALQPGVVVHGAVTLPAKSGDGWITIKTNAPDSAFPQRGTRVSPADARLMPVIESDGDSAIRTESGAHHYRFIGIEIRPKSETYIYNLIFFGEGAKSADALPHHIVFERCYVHGDPQVGGRRGIALNSAYTAIVDSYFSGFKGEGEDTQAISGWNGTGPFLIANNYLEGAGENIIFGGADPDITNLVPSDMVIKDNYIAKPLAWRNSKWTIKNLFELKNARRILFEHNILEYNWPQAQNGYSILFTPRNQDGGSPWSMVRDITFRKNVVRHVSSAVNIMGSDDLQPSQQTKRILIQDNLFEDVSDANWGGIGNLIQIFRGAADITVDHNTAFETYAALVAGGDPNQRVTFTNNIVQNAVYGVGGDNYYGDPVHALTTYFPGVVFKGNVIQGGYGPDYPSGNFFPAAISDIGFENYAAGDYRLQASSPYKNAATDGKDIGANPDSVAVAPRRRAAH